MDDFKKFDKGMSWNSKLFFLMAFLLLLFSYFTNASTFGFAISAALALLIVLVIDYFKIISRRFPKAWESIKIILIIIIVTMTLIGGINTLK